MPHNARAERDANQASRPMAAAPRLQICCQLRARSFGGVVTRAPLGAKSECLRQRANSTRGAQRACESLEFVASPAERPPLSDAEESRGADPAAGRRVGRMTMGFGVYERCTASGASAALTSSTAALLTQLHITLIDRQQARNAHQLLQPTTLAHLAVLWVLSGARRSSSDRSAHPAPEVVAPEPAGLVGVVVRACLKQEAAHDPKGLCAKEEAVGLGTQLRPRHLSARTHGAARPQRAHRMPSSSQACRGFQQAAHATALVCDDAGPVVMPGAGHVSAPSTTASLSPSAARRCSRRLGAKGGEPTAFLRHLLQLGDVDAHASARSELAPGHLASRPPCAALAATPSALSSALPNPHQDLRLRLVLRRVHRRRLP